MKNNRSGSLFIVLPCLYFEMSKLGNLDLKTRFSFFLFCCCLLGKNGDLDFIFLDDNRRKFTQNKSQLTTVPEKKFLFIYRLFPHLFFVGQFSDYSRPDYHHTMKYGMVEMLPIRNNIQTIGMELRAESRFSCCSKR